jgi:branched-subunit amino acid transport protein
MSAAWATVIIVGVATIAIKGAGTFVLHGRSLPASLEGPISMLAPVLLAALVATQTFGGDRALVVDDRALGVGVAAVLVALRAPTLVVVIAAAAITALARAI